MTRNAWIRSPLLVAAPSAEEDPFGVLDWTLFVGLSCVWGASFLLIALGLEAMPPGVVTFARVGFGAATLAVVAPAPVKFDAADRYRLIVMSILWVGIPFTLLPIAEQYINSAVTGLLNGATPIVAAGIAAIFLRRPPHPWQLVGIVVGFVGIALISLPSLGEGANQAAGVVMVLFATICYGISINIAPPLQQKYGSLNVMARMLALATIWTAPLGLAGLGEVRFEWVPWLAVAALGIVGTGLAFAMMATMVRRVGATRASLIAYLLPVVALVLGVLVNGDRVAPIALMGVVLILGGAALASRSKQRSAVVQRDATEDAGVPLAPPADAPPSASHAKP